MVVLLPERLSQYSTRKRLSFSTAGSYRGLPLSSVGTETAELAAPGTPVAGGSRAQPQPKVRARAVQTAPQPIRKTTRFIKTLLCKNREENFSVRSEYETAAFFIAELGDKTQLTAITFGANEGMSAALVVWIGCSLGLFAADILGMLVGYLLKSKTPDGLLNTLAFAIFSIFGVYTLYQGLKLIRRYVCPIPVWPILIAATVVFVVICVCLFIRREKEKND